MFNLTTVSDGPIPAVVASMSALKNGLAKEIGGRLACLGLLAAPADAVNVDTFASTVHGVIEGAVGAAPAGKIAAAVTAAVGGFVLVPADVDPADAMIDVHGVVYDVVNGKKLHVTEIPPAVPVLKPKKAAPGTVKPSVPAGADGGPTNEFLIGSIAPVTLDEFLSDAMQPLRVMVTRTLAKCRPAAYERYRTLKDAESPDARAVAYRFALAAYRKFIGA